MRYNDSLLVRLCPMDYIRVWFSHNTPSKIFQTKIMALYIARLQNILMQARHLICTFDPIAKYLNFLNFSVFMDLMCKK